MSAETFATAQVSSVGGSEKAALIAGFMLANPEVTTAQVHGQTYGAMANDLAAKTAAGGIAQSFRYSSVNAGPEGIAAGGGIQTQEELYR